MAGRRLPKSNLTTQQQSVLRADLTVRADWDAKTSFGPKPPSFAIFTETRDAFAIPNHYRPSGAPFFETQNAAAEHARRPALQFVGKLRPDLQQHEAARAAMAAFYSVGGGILSLPTGYGKTCVALYLICQLQQRALILVHKEFLADQWSERIKQFIPTAKVGRLQGTIIDVEGKDIVIGMLQSVCVKDYPLTAFGLVAVDESHHLAAPTFARALMRVPTTYTLGLSATRVRKDGLTRVIEWFLGPCFFEIARSAQRHVRVETLRYDKDFGPPLTFRVGREIKLNISGMITELCEDKARTQVLLSKICSLVDADRNIIVLTHRRSHCHELVELLQKRQVDAGLYMGGMKQSDLKESETCQVIVGTFSLSEEGLDLPKLDTIVLGAPKGDVIQSVGRILRESGQVKEHDPLVVDVRDNWSCFISQYNKRCKWYKSVGFPRAGLRMSQQPKRSEHHRPTAASVIKLSSVREPGTIYILIIMMAK